VCATARPGSSDRGCADSGARSTGRRGFLDYRVHPPTYNDNECVITYRFANAASLDRWLVSPQRLALIEESRALLIARPWRSASSSRDGLSLSRDSEAAACTDAFRLRGALLQIVEPG